jgi:hypothetical protein
MAIRAQLGTRAAFEGGRVMHLEFVPRKMLVQWLMAGWSPVEGHEYNPNDYAFLLAQKGISRRWSDAQAIAYRLTKEKTTGNSHLVRPWSRAA